MNALLKKTVAVAMIFQLLALSAPGLAAAALIGTGQAVESQARAEAVTRIDNALARGDVRAKLVEFGVDPDEARLRVAALSDAELYQLQAGIDALPAGGDSVLWVLGVVFLVLLVLEFVGVIDIFSKV